MIIFKNKHAARIALASVVIGLVVLFFALDLGRFFELAYVKQQQQLIADFYATHPVLFPFLYFITYVLVTALSIPGATILTIAAGALFGLLAGTLYVSFASAIGATLAFLISRYLLKGFLHDRHKDKHKAIDRGIEHDGGYYLFTIRLVPVFPYVLVNLLMGITTIRTTTFYWVSQLGMLPATIVYVNAGNQLADLESLSGILSADIILAFLLLGLLPLLTRLGLNWYERKRMQVPQNE